MAEMTAIKRGLCCRGEILRSLRNLLPGHWLSHS